MVDFKKLVRRKPHLDVKNLLALFESLDRQTSHIELRPVQREALEMLSGRREENDLILKISTGAGKTVHSYPSNVTRLRRQRDAQFPTPICGAP